MKQKDIELIIVVAFFAAIFSLILSQTLFVGKKDRELSAEIVDPISAQFNTPDKAVFNDKAINPTELIQIGDSNKTTPF